MLRNIVATKGIAAMIDSAQRVAGALTAAGQFLPRPDGQIGLDGPMTNESDDHLITLH
jgi:hypothetical protein